MVPFFSAGCSASTSGSGSLCSVQDSPNGDTSPEVEGCMVIRGICHSSLTFEHEACVTFSNGELSGKVAWHSFSEERESYHSNMSGIITKKSLLVVFAILSRYFRETMKFVFESKNCNRMKVSFLFFGKRNVSTVLTYTCGIRTNSILKLCSVIILLPCLS